MKSYRSILSSLPILPFLFWSAVANAAEPVTTATTTLARCQDSELTKADVEAVLATLPAEKVTGLRDSSSARLALATDLVVRRAIADTARRQGFTQQPQVAAQLALAMDKLVTDLYLERTETAAINEKALALAAHDEYVAFPERYRQEEVHARHILIRTTASCDRDARVMAQEVLSKISSGQSFEDLAKKYSDDSGSAASGGDLGWLTRGKTVTEFEDALYALKKPGEISGPVQTKFGIHLIQLVERKPPALQPFDNVKAGIMDGLRTKMRQEMRTKLIDALKKPEVLHVDDKVLGEAVGAVDSEK